MSLIRLIGLLFLACYLHWAADAGFGDAAAWLTGIVGEIYMWGVVASFAIAGWRYNAQLVIQGVIVSLGVSLIVRAFLPKK